MIKFASRDFSEKEIDIMRYLFKAVIVFLIL